LKETTQNLFTANIIVFYFILLKLFIFLNIGNMYILLVTCFSILFLFSILSLIGIIQEIYRLVVFLTVMSVLSLIRSVISRNGDHVIGSVIMILLNGIYAHLIYKREKSPKNQISGTDSPSYQRFTDNI
jgi:hypothetical protein